MIARLQEKYKKEISKILKNKFNYKNDLEIPKLEKVVINMGVGEAVKDNKKIDAAVKDLAAITSKKTVLSLSAVFLSTVPLKTTTPPNALSSSAL